MLISNRNYSCNNGSLANCAYVYSYAFTGGSDASSYTYVAQSDVDDSYNQAVNQYEGGETATARANVQGQVASNEQMSGGINCSHQLSDNHNVGDHATSVTAYIAVTCSAEVYDYNGARSLAASLLQKSITSTPDETQVGKITTNLLSAVGGSNGTVVVKVEAKGTDLPLQ
ncbi:MAG TPA: hypothetical protein VNE38_03530 [Ktedonobacteraceae bacterium]|nr:hypothetical protein [Ktedonobacteraceae bacterium]